MRYPPLFSNFFYSTVLISSPSSYDLGLLKGQQMVLACLLSLVLAGCGGVSGTQFLASKGEAEGGTLKVVEGGKEFVLTKGIELDYVYKSPKGLDRSIPIHLVKVSIGPTQQEQIFTTILISALKDKGFIMCQEPCSGRHYAFQVIQTGMHHGSRAWNWVGIALIAVPTSTTRIQLEGKLQDPNGNMLFAFADKRASKAFSTKGEDILKAEVSKVAEDIAFELSVMAKPSVSR